MPGASVRIDGDRLACGYCGSTLCGVEENWREGEVVLAEAPIVERFEAREMYVRPSVDSPQVVMREYHCRACAERVGGRSHHCGSPAAERSRGATGEYRALPDHRSAPDVVVRYETRRG